MKAIIWMEALPPALRKPWCVLVVCCNIRIAAASGRGVLGPAVIHADTGLALRAPATWLGGYQATRPLLLCFRVLPPSSVSGGDPDVCSVHRTKHHFHMFEFFLSLLFPPTSGNQGTATIAYT